MKLSVTWPGIPIEVERKLSIPNFWEIRKNEIEEHCAQDIYINAPKSPKKDKIRCIPQKLRTIPTVSKTRAVSSVEYYSLRARYS